MTIKEFVPLAPFTTFKVGGLARYFAEIKNENDLKETVMFARGNSVPFFVLGEGSNVLVSDLGFPGVVVKMKIGGIKEERNDGQIFLEAGAGEIWDNFVLYTIENGWRGAENLSGIPGSVGAGLVQNIGAYGAEISGLVFGVKVFNTEDGTLSFMSGKDLALGYRDSIFKKKEGKKLIIVSVIFCLSRNRPVEISYKDIKDYFLERGINNGEVGSRSVREAVLAIRSGKLPSLKNFGTAGSFFKNPVVSVQKADELKSLFTEMPVYNESEGKVKISAAFLIDKVADYKGLRRGDAGVYEKHALVLVNHGTATAKEIFNLSEEIKRIIAEKTGIFLEREVELVGEF